MRPAIGVALWVRSLAFAGALPCSELCFGFPLRCSYQSSCRDARHQRSVLAFLSMPSRLRSVIRRAGRQLHLAQECRSETAPLWIPHSFSMATRPKLCTCPWEEHVRAPIRCGLKRMATGLGLGQGWWPVKPSVALVTTINLFGSFAGPHRSTSSL